MTFPFMFMIFHVDLTRFNVFSALEFTKLRLLLQAFYSLLRSTPAPDSAEPSDR